MPSFMDFMAGTRRRYLLFFFVSFCTPCVSSLQVNARPQLFLTSSWRPRPKTMLYASLAYAGLWLGIYLTPWDFLIFFLFEKHNLWYDIEAMKNPKSDQYTSGLVHTRLSWDPSRKEATRFNTFHWKNDTRTDEDEKHLILYFGGNNEPTTRFYLSLLKKDPFEINPGLIRLADLLKADILFVEYPGKQWVHETKWPRGWTLVQSLATPRSMKSDADFYQLVDRCIDYINTQFPAYTCSVWGRSMGSAAAWRVLSTRPIHIGVIEAGFAYLPIYKISNALPYLFPGAWAFSMDATKQLQNRAPELTTDALWLFHDKKDPVVTFRHAKIMEQAVKNKFPLYKFKLFFREEKRSQNNPHAGCHLPAVTAKDILEVYESFFKSNE